jgi:cob(I)alamin adenosyltransferase
MAYWDSVKLYTRTGDAGETSLFDGTRTRKSDPRVAAYGDVDELNAWLGLAAASAADPALAAEIVPLQRDLFALGAQLADPADKIAARVVKATVSDADVERLEQAIDRLEAEVPPLRRFILAGGAPAGAALHVARTVCRRAERAVVMLAAREAVSDPARRYLNRLSDLLFVLARALNRAAGRSDVLWRHDRGRSGT